MDNQFYAAICDDEAVYMEQICSYLAAYESESGNTLVVEKYSSAKVLLDQLRSKEKRYDILFLDVEMPDMQGTDAAMEIRKFDADTVICFITSHENYAYQAFKVDAVGYLVKPVKYQDFKHMADKCTVQIQYKRDAETAENRYFRIKRERSEVIIQTQTIMYIEKKRNQCIFHLNDREVTCYDTLSHVYEQLDHQQFYYAHQGYIVNFDYIIEVETDRIDLQGDLEIPVSRRYYKDLREMHLDKVRRLAAARRLEVFGHE